MKYRFEYDTDGRRLMVAELDDELDCINCTDEELDCLGEYYRDMTVIFDIDLYCRLHKMLMASGDDRKKVQICIDATIRSISGSFEYALMDCRLEICSYGCFDVVAQWFWQNTITDFDVALAFPPKFYADPAVWFEQQINEKGICHND